MRRSLCAAVVAVLLGAVPATAQPVAVSGAGSTSAFNLVDQWRADSRLRVNYAGTGNTDGLTQFEARHVDFAVTETTYPQAGIPTTRPLTYIPVAAQAITVAYNVTVGGRKLTGLRLTPATATKIFTGAVTRWDDPVIAADNPGLALPAVPVVAVVRSDSSATTRHFTAWMNTVETQLWQAFCPGCGQQSVYPTAPGLVAMTGSIGVTNYLRQANGSITYVERSYASNAALPQASLRNQRGEFVAPEAGSVQLGLSVARQSPDGSVDYGPVFRDPTAGSYPLGLYSYLIAPTTVEGQFGQDRGAALAEFARYALCEGQAAGLRMGMAPLPTNQVRAGVALLNRIPGAAVTTCAPPGPPTQTITTEVEAGELLMSVEAGGVTLPSPVMAADGSVLTTTGRLRTITITDTRAGNPGWSLSGQLTDFTGTSGTIDRANAAWTPIVLDRAPGQQITEGAVADLSTSRTLAVATKGAGTAHLTARIDLWAPTSTRAGDYSALLTLTAI
ncbi:phosphate ABC transporter phosphate-binding protein [Actinokineospora baliensis]|uniref:substrate-binding domain-containing protein n=1 Tax=Actinokineospora baliensis TaxID=547056 RepID=UPI00195E753B|nr:substrate-binding domain-containing protein [Actinokineospora baliensis]MBM7773298.1 phosphate ABC transporter phosphate-binding protein [Actinokineospora baliensis]